MINPSSLDLQSLPWLPLTEKAAFPKQAAIYFGIDSLGCVQYIGRSTNVRARWGSHHKYSQLEAIGNIRIAYLFVNMPELLPEIETALISYFQPPLNVIGFKWGINKRNDPNYKQVIGYVHIEIVSKFRAKCIERNLNVSEAMEDALIAWNNKEN